MALVNKKAERLIGATNTDVEVPADLKGNLDFDVNSALLSATELTDMAGDQARQLMTGEIPEDLKEQISDLSVSTGMSGGFGYGEAGRKLEARDFGITSMDIRSRGSELAAQVAQSRNSIAQLAASIKESERTYSLALTDQNISKSQVALMGMELITKNQQYVSGLLSDLILNNSRQQIEGLQGNIDAIAGNSRTGQVGFFDDANATILELVNNLSNL